MDIVVVVILFPTYWSDCSFEFVLFLLKGLLHHKMIFFVINHLPPCRSKPVNASFVFGTQFKIFWMKTGRLVTVPLTAK